MAKKRKLKIGRLIIVLILLVLIVAGIIYAVCLIKDSKKETKEFNINDLHINELDYSEAKQLDIDLYSKEYLLIRLNDFKVLYASGNDIPIYPASLTKVLTMDSLLEICQDTNETANCSSQQREELIEDNASLAGLIPDKDYSIKELLYALILPSGGDAAVALSNYASNKGYDLVELMNQKCKQLALNNSHFTNTTGLHDDDLYTSLDDYANIVIDSLLKSDAKEILKTGEYELGNNVLKSTSLILQDRDDDIKVYGGKTGYTLEAGMNIMTLYEVNNRSYLLILANAEGSPYKHQYHVDDVNNIFDYLYN